MNKTNLKIMGTAVSMNILYEKGYSYHRGVNAYDEEISTVVEIDGRFFEFLYSGNHTRLIYRVDPIDEPEIPSPYDRDDGETYFWCRNSGSRDIFVLRYRNDSADPIISDLQKEVKVFAVNEFIANNFMYSEEYIKGLSLSTEAAAAAAAWRDACVSEALGGKWSLEAYYDIFKNIEDIVSGKAIVLCHMKANYSRPDDWVVNNEEIISGMSRNIFNWGQLCNNSWTRGTTFTVLKTVKEVEVEPGRFYCGSVYRQGYPVDVYRKGTTFTVKGCYSLSWDSQAWFKSLDPGLKCPRFELTTGLEGQFVADNVIVYNEKITKRNYFLEVMKAVQLAFNVSWKGASDLLAQAGTVTVLKLAVDLHNCQLGKKDLRLLLEKNSNLALDRFFNRLGLENKRPHGRFPEIKAAAELLVQQQQKLEV